MRLFRSLTAWLGRLKDGGTLRNDEMSDGSADDQTGGARAALDAQSKRRRERAERVRRLQDLAGVLVATPERDAAVADAERRADMQREMTGAEGLSKSEAVEWCGDAMRTCTPHTPTQESMTPHDCSWQRSR